MIRTEHECSYSQEALLRNGGSEKNEEMDGIYVPQ